MSGRSDLLADRIIQGAEKLAALIEGLSDEEYQSLVTNEKRPVGVLVHHVAVSYPIEIDLAMQLAEGKPIEGVTWDVIDGINEEHAHEFAKVDKSAVLDLLRKNSREAAMRVRKLNDEQLDNSAKVSLNANAPLTAQFFIEDHALRHSFQHFESIQEAIGK
ncbi:MAG: DinB family protein [Bacteroidota bacterium]